ncbi:alpha/beta hydrolase [Vagococcus sp. DIV0080]|uniref:Alpha/beta hydrolase n=1 Tax=Candidatus Vagococcus giribetii TaxID=2230876 RepID=A0ABS3HQ00_9ENTE|nr:alpha/beta hydrolase [Vagococcus sp. DIV0080]MBO0475706.1 alpha/beta hydrolase [Vagococcus sp. DIV0080]
MSRKYDESLVKTIKDKEYQTTKRGVEITVKPIPDFEGKGAMDPRLLKSTKKMNLMMKFMPKNLMKMDGSPKSIQRLRKIFNSVDSTEFIHDHFTRDNRVVKATDGYDIPISIFKSDTPLENAPILYFIHGGGFFAGSTDVVAEALKLFVTTTNMIAVGVDYRLAPENPYPIGHNDCYTVLKWIGENAASFGGDPKNIFVGGDSAGGNLTLYCSNKNIEDGLDLVRGQLLFYPTVNMGGVKDADTEFTIDDIDMYPEHEKYIRPGIEMFSQSTASLSDIIGTNDVMNKYLTPYMDVSEKSPVTFISSGEHDFLTIESLAYAKKLNKLGVDTTFTYYCGLGHAYLDHVGNYPQAEDCVADIGEFIRKNRV